MPTVLGPTLGSTDLSWRGQNSGIDMTIQPQGRNSAGAAGPGHSQGCHCPGIQDVGLATSTTWHWTLMGAGSQTQLFYCSSCLSSISAGVHYLSSASCIHLCTALDYTHDLWKPCCSRDGKATGTEKLEGDVAVPLPVLSCAPLTLHCRKPISHSSCTDCSGHHAFSSFLLGNSISRDEKIIT